MPIQNFGLPQLPTQPHQAAFHLAGKIDESLGTVLGFNAELPQHYGAVMSTDKERFNRFFHGMLSRGVYLAPALYEAGFVSAAHSDADIAATAAAAREAFAL